MLILDDKGNEMGMAKEKALIFAKVYYFSLQSGSSNKKGVHILKTPISYE